jgi:hypothetical protein
MPTIDDALRRFRQKSEVTSSDGETRLVSSVGAGVRPGEVQAAWGRLDVPDDAKALWHACRSARLFEDVAQGLWGLVLLDPHDSAQRTQLERQRRAGDFRADDVVIGELLGDQELLVIAPSEHADRRILVALPLDARADWYGSGGELAEFLERYFDAGGDKYWEPPRRTN